MKSHRLGGVVLAMSLWTGAGEATNTAAQLEDFCRQDGTRPQAEMLMGWCLGYVMGVVDMIPVMNLAGRPGKPQICLPADGIDPETAVTTFLRWLNAHPQARQETARLILVAAMGGRLPLSSACGQTQRRDAMTPDAQGLGWPPSGWLSWRTTRRTRTRGSP
jgi:hypothetical protein